MHLGNLIFSGQLKKVNGRLKPSAIQFNHLAVVENLNQIVL